MPTEVQRGFSKATEIWLFVMGQKMTHRELPCILAVDDEPAILSLISSAFKDEGFEVVTASSVAEFWQRNTEYKADFYIIDITLPDGSGFNLVKELRETSNCGILMLSGRDSETDHVVGLEIGADDYVTKPFRLRELSARVNAIYRRASIHRERSKTECLPLEDRDAASKSIEIIFGNYRLSLSARRLWGPDGVEIDLTTAEFELLAVLLKRRSQVLTRNQIMNAMKGRDWESYDRAVDGLVSRLRKKIQPNDVGVEYIRTIHGVGYSFNAEN